MSPTSIRHADGQTRLMTKIARMYHERGIRQATIAATLSISQAKVSRLLKRAEQVGIVRTIVTAAPDVYGELEDELETRFGLKEAVIVDVDPDADEAEVLASIGAGAAGYLEASFSGNDRIGVSSWSQTVLAMVERMRPLNPRGATEVVQLLGGLGTPDAQSHSNRILGELARMIGADPVYVSVPGVVADAHTRDSLLRDGSMQEVTRHWRELTVAIMGIGSIEPSDVLETSGNAFSADERTHLIEAGAVGDICHRIFRADGSLVEGDLDDRIIAIPTDDLLRIPRRVGLAGGPRKVDAIRGALQGDWITTLITDVRTAEAL
ncbi:sugar-binding transcriptional regulator [Microbacterium excoecariae]|uniref:sugar-binding transcriptional regulator n=1 Tax=Microbacterium excoecariae TaxID=2715210 RepID=UPI00140AEBD5|nr:sugar-binding transcriptional regulator [Microbacterium excoecariae]NHI15744.1 sugar-binding transcriptional regulator [Microbacterium excoecariae]